MLVRSSSKAVIQGSIVAWHFGVSAQLAVMAQLWMGNIPHGMPEAQVLLELSAYGVRPLKAVVRHRAAGGDGFCIASFASEALAQQALQLQWHCWWSDGKYILMRSSYYQYLI